MSRARFLVFVSLSCMAWSACTDGSGPTASGRAVALGIVPSFQVDPALFAGDPVDQIRLTAYDVSTSTVVGTFDEAVRPTADQWVLSLDVDLGDAESLQVFVDAELLSQGRVVWSGRLGPLTVPSAAPALAMDVYPGPLDNQDVTGVQIVGVPPVLVEGGATDLSATVSLVEGSDAAAVVYWASSDESVAIVAPQNAEGTTAQLVAVAPGPVDIIATAGSAFDEVRLEVLALGAATKTWVGGDVSNPTLWTTAANWTPTGVPGGTDLVLIPATSNDPQVDASVSITSLTVQAGASLDLQQSSFQVARDLSAPGTISNGELEITGAGALLEGNVDGLLVSANRALSGTLDLSGDLRMAATLSIGSQTAYVGGSLQVLQGGGLLSMTGPGLVSVAGSVDFAGGSHEGLLTDGRLVVGGSFVVSSSDPLGFAAAAGHEVWLDGSDNQTIDFAQAGPSANQFGTLRIRNPFGVGLQANAHAYDVVVDGVLFVGQGQTFSMGNRLTLNAGATLDVFGTVTAAECVNYGAVIQGDGVVPDCSNGFTKTWVGGDPNGSLNGWSNPQNWTPAGVPGASDIVLIPSAAYSPVLTANADVESLVLGSGGQLDLVDFVLSVSTDLVADGGGIFGGTVRVTGAGDQLRGFVPQLELLVDRAATGSLYLDSDLLLTDAALDVSNQYVSIAGSIVVSGAVGRLIMTNVDGGVFVEGGATFDGTSHDGLLTDGGLYVSGDFAVTASSTTGFVSSGSHAVFFNGLAPQSVTFAAPGATQQRFNDLWISNSAGVSFDSDAYVSGDVQLTGLMDVPANSTVTVAGDLTLYSLSQLSVDGTLVVLGSCIDQGGTVTGSGTIPAECGAPASVDRTWTGEISADWNTDDNWNPVGVPGPTDGVLIPGGVALPVLASDVTIGSLSISAGNQVDLAGFTMTVSGDVSASSGSVLNGLVHVTGEGSILEGYFTDLRVSADRSVTSAVFIDGNLTVEGTLNTANHAVYVYGNLDVSGSSGVLQMTDPSTYVYVQGTATFNGGDHSGALTDGYLDIYGDFLATEASPFSFVASGNHLTVFGGNQAAQTVTFETPGSNAQRLAEVHFNNFLGVTLASSLHATGDVLVQYKLTVPAATTTSTDSGLNLATGSLFDVDGTVTATGGCTDNGAIIIGTGSQPCGAFTPVDRYWTGLSGSNLWDEPDNWEPAGVPQPSEQILVLYAAELPVLTQNVPVAGLTLQSSATVNLNGNTLTIAGDVTANGFIENGLTEVTGTGNVFQGNFDGLLLTGPRTTSGAVIVNGDLTVQHTLDIDAGAVYVYGAGGLTVETDTGEILMDQQGEILYVIGDALFDGADGEFDMTGGTFYLEGDLTVENTNGSSRAFKPSGEHITYLAGVQTQTITFSNPGGDVGQSFNHLDLYNGAGGNNVVFASDAIVSGNLTASQQVLVGSGLYTLEVGGQVNLFAPTFNGLMFAMVGPEAPTASQHTLSSPTFTGMPNDVVQLYVQIPGEGPNGPLTLTNPVFDSPPVEGYYLVAADPANTPGTELYVTLTNPTTPQVPTAGVDYLASGQAVITWGP